MTEPMSESNGSTTTSYDDKGINPSPTRVPSLSIIPSHSQKDVQQAGTYIAYIKIKIIKIIIIKILNQIRIIIIKIIKIIKIIIIIIKIIKIIKIDKIWYGPKSSCTFLMIYHMDNRI